MSTEPADVDVTRIPADDFAELLAAAPIQRSPRGGIRYGRDPALSLPASALRDAPPEREPRAVTITADFSTEDPRLAVLLRAVQALPEDAPERHEAEAHLHLELARVAWRRADALRGTSARP